MMVPMFTKKPTTKSPQRFSPYNTRNVRPLQWDVDVFDLNDNSESDPDYIDNGRSDRIEKMRFQSPQKPPPLPIQSYAKTVPHKTRKGKRRRYQRNRAKDIDMSLFENEDTLKWSLKDFQAFVSKLTTEQQLIHDDAIHFVERKVKNRLSAKRCRDEKNKLIKDLYEENQALKKEAANCKCKNNPIIDLDQFI